MKSYTLWLIGLLVSWLSTGHTQIVINEIMYNPPESGADSLEFIELYNAGSDTLSLHQWAFSKGVQFTFPDTAVPPQGYLVVCINTRAFQQVYGTSALEWESGALRNSGEALVLVDAQGQTIDSVYYQPAGNWPALANGQGHSLELCDPTRDNSIPSHWKASQTSTQRQVNGKTVYASPGAQNQVPCADAVVKVMNNYFQPSNIRIKTGWTVEWQNVEGLHNVNGKKSIYPDNPIEFYSGAPQSGNWRFAFRFDTPGIYHYHCDVHRGSGMNGIIEVVNDTPPPILLTEIMYNPPALSDDSLEFIEIYNAGPDSIDMRGLYFSAGITFHFPDTSMPPHAYWVIAKDSIAMHNVFGVEAFQWEDGALSNGGERIELKTALHTVIFSVQYDDEDPWPTQADGEGFALALCDLHADLEAPEAWGINAHNSGVVLSDRTLFTRPGAADTCRTTVDDYPLYRISQLRGVDSVGLPDSIDVRCRVRGVVYGVDLQRGNRIQFTLLDAADRAGIGVFGTQNYGYTVREGDSLEIKGRVSFFNGLTQIFVEGITLLDSMRPLVTPRVVTQLDESTESDLIQLREVQLVDSTEWQGNGRFFVVHVTDGTNQYTVYIDDAVELSRMPPPKGKFHLTGIGGQFDRESPYFDGYQIVPRYAKDIERITRTIPQIKATSTPIIVPNPAFSYLRIDGLTAEDFPLRCEVYNPQGIRIMSLVWKEKRTGQKIPIAHLRDGYYLLHLHTSRGMQYVRGFVKLAD